MFLANKLNKGAGSPAALDAQFNYVTMLLHGDGTNGAQNNTFLDSSTNNYTITRYGNTTQGSFSPYGSNWANFFDGTSDNLTYTGGSSLNFGTSDFTIELWVFLTNTGTYSPFLRPDDSGAFPEFGYNFSTGQLQFDARNAAIVSVTTTLPTNQWTHVAVSRSGTSLRLFVNGTQVGSTTTNSTNFGSTTGTIRIGGSSFSATHNVNGYLSNFRVLKGTAAYTTTFTPSTTPLTAITNTTLLTCQSNRFVDNSTNNYTLTATGTPSVQRFNPFGASTAYSTSVIGGSGYFDGSGDYLTAPDNTALDLSGDFTVEAWVNVDNVSSEYCVFHNHTSNTNGIALTVNSGAPRLLSGNGSWQVLLDSSITIKPNTWNHIAGTRSGNTYTIWVNGVSGGTASNSSTPTYSGGAQIGRLTSGVPIAYIGYMSNLRVVKGTAVYTTTFTPSTTPLTAISGTSLLLAYTNGAIFDNAMMNDLETVGNAQISTSVVKYGTGSLAFDGTGDYIVSALTATPNLNLGAGSFTLEFWVNPNALTNEARMVTIEVPSSTTVGVIMGGGGSGGSNSDVQVNQFGAGTRLSASAVLSTGTWVHVAVTYNGTTSTLWIDGVSKNTYSGSVFPNSNCYVTMGGSVNYSSSTFNGYLDDVRITKGYCRYTTTFTPPTAAFPNTGPI